MKAHRPALARRHFLTGLLALGALAPAAAFAQSSAAIKRGTLLGSDFGIVPDGEADQSALFQKAVDAAATAGLALVLAGGRYTASNVQIPAGCTIIGAAGAAEINAARDEPIFVADGQPGIVLQNLHFQGISQDSGAGDGRSGLLAFKGCENLQLTGLRLGTGHGNGLYLDGCSGRITGSDFTNFQAAGIFAINSRDLTFAQNRVTNCGNGGILIWRDEAGRDGTIVTANHISEIYARDGGSGQNGNGINVFRADNVIISDNVIDNCAFSAVRVNTGKNTAIRGNTCTNSGEIALYSEFAFSGSVIANNIVDGAAGGISITNLDQGGRLAVCTGNIVRNILPRSAANPDVTPFGIYAEADTTITGNSIDSVPGIGIVGGVGTFLRNVVIASNVVSGVHIGIGVSVVDGAGAVQVSGNIVSGATEHGIVGLRWNDIASDDLVRDAGKFPGVVVSGNTVA
ncbi:MAG TPA: TIGR03808 family TAT-translocated repetitive protein [Arsenicitalea sp.]|jgi:uncharacterized secreted repeat protein (TIGR03808 family)|nr:TIGR03808 family TAT-translocated repetitive protein [Arsenicitalea sp.]